MTTSIQAHDNGGAIFIVKKNADDPLREEREHVPDRDRFDDRDHLCFCDTGLVHVHLQDCLFLTCEYAICHGKPAKDCKRGNLLFLTGHVCHQPGNAGELGGLEYLDRGTGGCAVIADDICQLVHPGFIHDAVRCNNGQY